MLPNAEEQSPLDREREVQALSDEIGELSAHIAASKHRLLTRVRRFDELEGWHAWGARSCAEWLAWRTNVKLGTARAQVQVARRLAELPQVDEAFGRGELSYCKARAICRYATPATEEQLIGLGTECTGNQLERIGKMFRDSLGQAEERPPDVEPERRLHVCQHRDGSYELRVSGLSADEVEVVVRAVDALLATERGDGRSEPQPAAREEAGPDGSAESSPAGPVVEEPRGSAEPSPDPVALEEAERVARLGRVDGLIMMAEDTLARGKPARTAPGRHEVLVLADGGLQEGVLHSGRPISAAALNRIACDGALRPVLVDPQGLPLAMGRRARKVTAALAKALRLRDGGCRFPGCRNRFFVDAHHVEAWSEGGATDLCNLVLLCRTHHRLIHEGKFRLVLDEQQRIHVWDAKGRPLTASGPRAPVTEEPAEWLRRHSREAGLQIDATTGLASFARWVNAASAVDGLGELEERYRRSA